MYAYKEINGQPYVQHIESGCTMPWHSSRTANLKAYGAVADYKRDYFYNWVFKYSNYERKKVRYNPMEDCCAKNLTMNDLCSSDKALAKTNVCEPHHISFAPCTSTAPCAVPQKKSKKMYNDYDEYETPIQTRTDETRKRDYLVQRLDCANEKKNSDLRAMFNMDDDRAPMNFVELQDRLSKGLFIIKDEDKEKEGHWPFLSPLTYVKWRDPSKPADEKGFEAALKDKYIEYVKAEDQIKIADPADGLKALQAFEAWAPTTDTATAH